jgi:hypothetical protein
LAAFAPAERAPPRHRDKKTYSRHHDRERNAGEEEMQPPEAGIEAEQETQHWRTFLGQLRIDCFPSREPVSISIGLWFRAAYRDY